ncbi:MAG: L-asparaginase [Gemmatimonadetes bacterium]|nr:L-asparaginase [Gemmatimonadota bacterium]
MPRHFLALLLLAAACQKGPRVEVDPAPQSLDPQRLTEVLDAQFRESAADWNAGDLEGFMSAYANDTSTMFLSGSRFEHGFAWIEQNYAPAFAPGAKRDSLRIEGLTARPLGTTFALVTARYVLYRDGVTTSSGPFSVVMQEGTDGWKIILDHTSSDPR